MAQSRDMYIAQGKADRKANVIARYPSTATSWQGKAYREGFDSPVKASKAKVIKGAKPAFSVPEHVNHLIDHTHYAESVPAMDEACKEALQDSLPVNHPGHKSYYDDHGQNILNTWEAVKATKPVKVIASRRKREGKYAGKCSGKHVRDKWAFFYPSSSMARMCRFQRF